MDEVAAAVAQRERAGAPLMVGVTSHRNLVAAEAPALRARVRDFFARLQREFPGLAVTVVSALAEGGDQLVAEEAIAAGLRSIAVLPMWRADYATDFTDAARSRFDALCAQSDVIELPAIGRESPDPGAPAPSGGERDRRYAQAGVYVSSHSHVLLAIWDGRDPDLLGGTSQIVRYHLRGERPLAVDRRRSRRLGGALAEDVERPVYHVVCSRDTRDGSPAPPLRALETYWRVADRAYAGDGPMPPEARAAIAHMQAFDADAQKYRRDIDAGRRRARPGGRDGSGVIDRLFEAADWLAIHFQRRVLFAMRAIYTLAALMGIAFMSYSDLPAQDYMIFVFLALFAFGVAVSVVARRRGWHRKYLDYRALAEGLRVQAYWRRAGLSVTADAEFAHDNFLQKQDVELGWIRNVMRSAGLEAELELHRAEPEALERVIAEWVGESGRGGQLDYYERRARERTRLHRVTETLGAISLWLGIGISVFLAVFFLRLTPDEKTVLVAIMAVASIAAAVREAYAYRKADKELIKQYRFMCRIFASARAALDRTADADEQREILRSLGEAALAEHAEWALMHRERPLEHARF